LVNVLVKAMLRTPFAPEGTYLLCVRGRKTGRRYSTPVRLVEDGHGRFLVAPYGERGWVKNARAAGSVELSRRGRTERLRAEELSAAEAAPVLQRYVRQIPVTRPFFDARSDDPVETFAAEADRHPVFRLVEG
jgi:deazaflavin-dependent oxidoreductase (nitroreductase family)